MGFDRTDEVEFLRRLPKTIARYATVLRAGEFSPGGPGLYAWAYVLCVWNNDAQCYGVQRAYYNDDRPPDDPYLWTVGDSRYFSDYERAKKELAERV